MTTTTTSSSGDYVSATEDAGGSARPVPANVLRHQRNKEQFDRLFGKVKRDPNLRNHSPVIGGGVSLATILQDNGRKQQQHDNADENGWSKVEEMQHQMQLNASPQTCPVQSTLVSQFGNNIVRRNFVEGIRRRTISWINTKKDCENNHGKKYYDRKRYKKSSCNRISRNMMICS